jgi:hypothetical protein
MGVTVSLPWNKETESVSLPSWCLGQEVKINANKYVTIQQMHSATINFQHMMLKLTEISANPLVSILFVSISPRKHSNNTKYN